MGIALAKFVIFLSVIPLYDVKCVAMLPGKMIDNVDHFTNISSAEENPVLGLAIKGINMCLSQIFLFEFTYYPTVSKENGIKDFEKKKVDGRCHFKEQSL